jgi:surface protein
MRDGMSPGYNGVLQGPYLSEYVIDDGNALCECMDGFYNSFLDSSYVNGICVYRPTTKNELQISVDMWCLNQTMAKSQYGDISVWDTSSITDMSFLFHKKESFNSDISQWILSNVTNMNSMFKLAWNFNQGIESWNTSRVTDMGSLFTSALSFNQNLRGWDVSNVENMTSIFDDTPAFVQNFCWDVRDMILSSNVGILQGPYLSDYVIINNNPRCDCADGYYLDLSKANQNNGMCIYLPSSNSELKSAVDAWMSDRSGASVQYGDIGTWDTSLITSMYGLFRNQFGFDSDISTWDVSKVTDMGYMFKGTSFNQNISAWDVSKVTSMSSMFYQASSFNQDIGSWDVSKVTSMSGMFYQA